MSNTSDLDQWYLFEDLQLHYDSTKCEYTLNGKLHRNAGPARITHLGTKIWYRYGEICRDNGPAIEYSDGRQSKWFKNGVECARPRKTDELICI